MVCSSVCLSVYLCLHNLYHFSIFGHKFWMVSGRVSHVYWPCLMSFCLILTFSLWSMKLCEKMIYQYCLMTYRRHWCFTDVILQFCIHRIWQYRCYSTFFSSKLQTSYLYFQVGTIACPVLPLIGALSNLIFFFVNYLIVSRTCKPPIKRWNQSRNTTFLMGFLLITILFIIVPVSVMIGRYTIHVMYLYLR